MAGGNRHRLLIIGGGIMGLGIGWRLAQAGWQVELFERDNVGKGASWAAAGMLAARIQGGSQPRDPYSRFLRRSQDLWPSFKDELEVFTGRQIGYRDEGTLIAAFSSEEVTQFKQMASWQPDDFFYLSSVDALAREPAFSPEIDGALLSVHDHHVDNRAYAQALASAFTKAGGTLHEQVEVTDFIRDKETIVGVRTRNSEYTADRMLLAAGAWSAEIPGAGTDAPIHPTKGQMVALKMDPDRPLIQHAVWGPGIYLVPRQSGRLVLGATTEEVGFDRRVTASGVLQLLAAARHTVPDIEDLEIEETWAGFRPTSADHMPVMGPGHHEGLILATGHGHNGILMSAGTIELMANWLKGGQMDPVLHPFLPNRFQRR
ncbi:MAG: glycine oxidase ThiO [Pseudomonadota bacterium]